MTLEQCLAEQIVAPGPIIELTRTPSPYHSSFAIENLKVILGDSKELDIIFKNVGRDGLLREAIQVKPEFIYDPLREIRVYNSILAGAGLDTALCYGSVADTGRGRYWLFLEMVRGVELYRVGNLSVWERAAACLARLHQVKVSPETTAHCHLLNYDGDFYRRWLARARRFCPGAELEWVAKRYEGVIDRLLNLPASFIHGEFYASNVIVTSSDIYSRVVPIDWEMAAIGPSLMDVAALTAGKWRDEERRQLASAYRDQMRQSGTDQQPTDEFVESIEYCRLHQCIQWLGWAADWSPPEEHAHDWLREAVGIAERLGM